MNIPNGKLYQKINSIRTWSSRKAEFLSEITSILQLKLWKEVVFFVVQVALVLTLQATLKTSVKFNLQRQLSTGN